MATLLFPLQFERQEALPLDRDMVFTTTAARIAYLTSGLRYPGMLVSDTEDGKVYVLNPAGTAWVEIGAGGSAPVTLTDAATIAVDASLGNTFKVTLSNSPGPGATRMLGNPTNLTDGMVLNFLITQDGTGNRALTYDTKYLWGLGGEYAAPGISTTAGAVDLVSCIYEAATGNLHCSLLGAIADVTTTKGDILVRSATTETRLPVGTNTQVLTANSAATLGVSWEAVPAGSPTTTKGDLIARSATADARLPIGTDTYVLTANSAATLGMSWTTAAAVTPTTTLGDLIVRGATNDIRLPLGANTYVLTANTANATSGIEWTAAATGVSLSAVNVWTKNQSSLPVTLTDGATIAVDASLSNVFRVTLGGNRTLANPTNLTDGMVLNFLITQDATGGRTLAYDTKYKWGLGGNSTAPALTTIIGAEDLVSCIYDLASDTLRCVLLGAVGLSTSTLNVFTKNQSVAPVALVDAATITVDASLSNTFRVTLGGNRTLGNPTNLSDGMVINFVITQDGTGSRTLAYQSKYKWGLGGAATAPALSTTIGAVDLISCVYDATSDTLRCAMIDTANVIGASAKTLSFNNTITLAGTDSTTMTFPPASANVGYINLPQNSQSTAYTTVSADQGKHIFHPSADTSARTITIDSNANVPYPVGTALTFVNQSGAGVMTIAINADVMRLAGAGTTGSRTLAANGVATSLKVTSTEWIISGTGLT